MMQNWTKKNTTKNEDDEKIEKLKKKIISMVMYM